MRTIISNTVGMTLLVVSFNLFLASENTIDSPWFFTAVILAILAFVCWSDALNSAKKEDRNKKKDRKDMRKLTRMLINEVRELRKDLRGRNGS